MIQFNRFNKATAGVLAILMLVLSILSGCTSETADPDDSEASTAATESEYGSETESETEAETEEPYVNYGELPAREPIETLVTGDGMEFSHYDGSTEEEFELSTVWMFENGYTLYCERDTENTLSATYVKGKAYATAFFRRGYNDLYLGFSSQGGETLPPRDLPYEKVCETTVTLPGLSGEGMCQILRLADGSFLVIDSGTASAGDEIYAELCRLNGSSENIRICAWLLTHSHSDHYGGFKTFLSNHRQKVDIDYVLYAPITRSVIDTMDSYNVSWNTIDYYFNITLPYTMQLIPEATLVPVHAGQTFTFADVELQILFTPEYLYVSEIPVDYNNSSIVSRVVNKDGAAIFMADNGAEASQWIAKTYDSELRSNIMQMTHHGMSTDNDLAMMKEVQASTYMWPCSEAKFNKYWGLACIAKQYAIASAENLIHGCGSATRPLSYVGVREKGTEILAGQNVNVIAHGVTLTASDAISYTVTNASDPYVCFETDLDTEKYNALRVKVKCREFKSCLLYWTSGDQTPMTFTEENSKPLGPQGGSMEDGYVTLIVYLGNGADFHGDITSLRIDLGTKKGDTVEIVSIEAYWMNVDEITE